MKTARKTRFLGLKHLRDGSVLRAKLKIFMLMSLVLEGFQLTKQSLWRPKPIWQAIAANRNALVARFANQPGMGLHFSHLGRDASAAAAARRLNSQKKSLEVVESVGVSRKVDPKRLDNV